MRFEPQNFEMFSGDSEILRFTVTDDSGMAQSLASIVSARFALAASSRSPTLATKSLGSGITVTDAANGLVEVELDPSDTADISGGRRSADRPGREYYHELELTDSSGNVSTVAYGWVTVLRDLQA